jgi:hypothetical protein
MSVLCHCIQQIKYVILKIRNLIKTEGCNQLPALCFFIENKSKVLK